MQSGMRSGELRIKFLNRNIRKRFFLNLKTKTSSKTYKELSEKIAIPNGRLNLYKSGSRSIPLDLVQQWMKIANINLQTSEYKTINTRELLVKYSKKGVKALEKKYGDDWAKITGSRSMKKLRKEFKNPKLKKK